MDASEIEAFDDGTVGGHGALKRLVVHDHVQPSDEVRDMTHEKLAHPGDVAW